MPDRILAAANKLHDEAASLHVDLERFQRSQRIKNAIGLVLLAAILLLAGYNLIDRNRDDQARCETTNSSRLAIRQAVNASGDSLVQVAADFAGTDDPLTVRLRTDHAKVNAELAAALPVKECG